MSSDEERWEERLPGELYVRAEYVIRMMGRFGRERLETLSTSRVLVLAMIGGGFITVGALFSILLAAGAEGEGLIRLREGLGFSTGFFFVVLSETVLFTEANVVMPATLLEAEPRWQRVLRFWVLAWIGNFVGALVVGWLISVAQDYSPHVVELLSEVVATKMAFREAGGVGSWFQIILSGMLANWLVGMAAFFATMGRTIFGKYIPVALAVTLFVSANFQHSPANMGYFSLLIAEAGGPGWGSALGWNIIPAGIGNLIGGTLFVALPFWWVFEWGRTD